ncbi:MAG TPA: LPS assembly lipoprotein LptE [Caulobacteraceae bacterium]|jgi:LPS-assembly lipoprotein|nr:LPS assembly lipoprotein LptE [Caulobacteraceae bacterium]
MSPRRFRLVVGAIATLAPALAGCGFTPMYATPGVSAGLASIDVTAPHGRLGYLLREDLDDALGRDKSAPPAYRLELTMVQSRGPRGLNIADVADYYDLGLTVQYRLVSIVTGKVAASGAVTSQVSYDDTGQAYADIAAAQDAQGRVASDAAQRIQIQLASWMHRQAPGD